MKYRMMPLMLVCAVAIFAACNKDDNNNNNTSVSAADAAFTTMAAMSNHAEISAAQLALTKSSDADILAFANRMISDHQHAQDSLKLIATPLGLNAPDTVNTEQAAVAAQLKMLSGRAFDSAYAFTEADGHVKTIALMNEESVNGTNSALKQYVSTYLPAIEMHQDMAYMLIAKY